LQLQEADMATTAKGSVGSGIKKASASTRNSEPIFDYLGILAQSGPGSSQAEEFKRRHAGDQEFEAMAKGAEYLTTHRKKILEVIKAEEHCVA
jgi:hypothetical protein